VSFARFSVHCQAEIRMGGTPLRPCNMHGGADRLAYLDGLLRFIELGFGDPASPFFRNPALARQWLTRVPMGEGLVDIVEQGGDVLVREGEGIREELAFEPEALSICIFDGRRRDRTISLFPTGTATSNMGRLMSALTTGIEVDDLMRLGASVNLDARDLLDALLDDGAIDQLDELSPRLSAPLSVGAGDWLTWTGHAGFVLQSSGTTLWVDPWLLPQMVWQDDELRSLFSPDFADSLLFDPYGPETKNLCVQTLPRPDAVLITHQDVDHFRMEVLMALPPDVPIVVPRASAVPHPWEVPMKAIIHRLLGADRRVIELGHGEHVTFGTYRVSAFPFHGEFPVTLPHTWNCYLVQTEHSAVAITSDSKASAEDVDVIAGLLVRPDIPLTLLAQPPRTREVDPGYRDATYELYNPSRLWPWYVRLHAMFDPTPKSCLTWNFVASLAERTHLVSYFPCAAGCCPWFRLPPSTPFQTPIVHLLRRDLEDAKEKLAAVTRRTVLFPGKHGQPYRLA
jgi:L-ascorbate metabolism protein UlaG (beta-lactamase superfamily)